MGRAGLIATALVLTGMIGGAAGAQNLRDPSPPAEQPPGSFSGTQFVDSRGCVYVRAGLGGDTNWVPRVNRERKQLCGFEPTLTAMAAPTPAPQPAPASDSARTAADPTLAGAASDPAAEPTPRVLRQPTPEADRPVPRRRISRAEACAGRSGVQPNMISARTGDPVDCGPPEAPAEAAAGPARPTLTRAQACAGRSGVQPTLVSARTGAPIDCGPAPRSQPAADAGAAAPAAPPRRGGPRRMTMAELCAEQARTDRRFVNVRTGRPVSCTLPGATSAPDAAQPRGLQAAALTRPQGGYATPLDGAPGTTATRPGPTAGRAGPAAYSNPLDRAPGSTGTAQPQVARANTGWLFGSPAPYSNPAGARQDITPAPPEGYETAWTDGRLNPDRGEPNQVRYATRGASSTAKPSPASEASAGVAHAGHRYVQVRTFTSRAAAQDAARGLRDRGLPMRIGVYTRGGTEYRMVLAGPFTSNSGLRHALSTARGAGYPGATTRR